MNPLPTPEAAVKTHSELLREYLSAEVEPSPCRIARRPMGVNPPLSCAQEDVWRHAQINPTTPVFNEPVTIYRKGPLNVSLLERSLASVIERHEAWRTNFELIDGQPAQIVRGVPEIKLALIDLCHLPKGAEREAAARHMAAEQVRQPFDLERDLLMRGQLVRLDENDYQLQLTFHHIIFDGFSLYRVLLPELLTYYQAYSRNEVPCLPELPVQYPDYAVWQRSGELEGTLKNQLEYWRGQVGGAAHVLDMPTDRSRPAVQRCSGAMHRFELSRELSDAIRAVSLREEATLFMFLLTAFSVLLHRYSGQDDFVVGSVNSSRKLWELEGLLGCFQNLVPLRMDLSEEPTFRKLLRRAREVTLGALSNDEIGFGTLVRELQPEHDFSRNPLVQVMISLVPRMEAIAPGWDLSQMDTDVNTSRFDLELDADDRAEGIRGRFVYNTDLFDSTTITRMIGHWGNLLQGIVADPELPISRLSLLGDSEKKLLSSWNQTGAEFPREKCIHELVEAQAALTPGAVAVQQERTSLTYEELNARANRLAHYLRKQGVGPEVRVGVYMHGSPDLAISLLGTLKAGGSCVPLDPKYPKERLAHMLEDAQIKVVLASERALPVLAEFSPMVIVLTEHAETIAREKRENLTNLVTPENCAYVIYTSGSTGKPRGVMLEHRGLVNHNIAAIKLFDLGPKDRVLQFSSISFDIAIEEMFPTWMSGGAVVFQTEERDLVASQFLPWIRRQRITVLDLPTAYWHELVHQLSDLRERLPETLRLVIVGGEKASSSALADWRKVAGTAIRWINTYGPTEASVIATAYEPRSERPTQLPIGRPIANVQTYILDSHLQQVPIGVPGELHIGGVGLARGYLNQPDLTAARFIDNPFSESEPSRLYKTGDVVRYLPDGNIEFLGRVDDQVKIRGFRVELGEIETLLNQHPAIDQAVVVARKNDLGENSLVAYIVPARQATILRREVVSFLAGKLPDYMVPASLVTLQKLPLTPNGKLDRRALPAPSGADSCVGGESLEGPRDALETQLVKIWESVLGTSPIGIRQTFFELGGHSLLAVRLMHRIEREMGKKLPITALLERPTVERLAEVIGKEEGTAEWSSLVAIQQEGWRPPFFCVHGIGGTVLRFYELARHLGPDQPVYGLQAQGVSGKHPCQSRVEDMAAHYLTEIRRLQPQGPYYLGGYSLGGSVALEMARQLREEGEEVAIVALLDTFASTYRSKGELLVKFLTLAPREKLYHVRRKGRLLGKSIRRTVAMARLPRVLKEVRQACHQAAKQYVAQPYLGEITLFHAEEKSLSSENPYETWKTLALGGLEVHEVPGGHGSIIDEPAVTFLAEKLKACLERAQAEHLEVLSQPIARCERASNAR
jgi:amino acid adenylation domain-containing protein